MALGLCGTTLPGLAAQAAAPNPDQWQWCQGRPQLALEYPGPADALIGPSYMSAAAVEGNTDEVIHLFGDVLVQQPQTQLRADRASFFQLTNEIEAEGNVEFLTADYVANSRHVRFNSETGIGQFAGADLFLYERHATVTSETIDKISDELTIIQDGSYTTCDDDDWRLQASKIRLMHDRGLGSATHTVLELAGVPVFYLPYFMFPITDERMTGMLPPSFGRSDDHGTEISVPIYLNLHPQLDATVTPHNYSKRGLQWQSELRYLTQIGRGELYWEQLDDDIYGDDRQLIDFSHGGGLGYGWSSFVDYAEVSDRDYFRDFGNSLSETSTAHLPQRAGLRHANAIGSFSVEAQDFYTVDDELAEASRPYRLLPQLDYSLSPIDAGGVMLELDAELSRFQREDRQNGKRLLLQPSLSLPWYRAGGYMIPKLSLHHTEYELDSFSSEDARTLERDVPIYSLEGGLYFERDLFAFSNAYLQTLEPKLFYLHVPYRDQADVPRFDTGRMGFSSALLYSDNRFSGPDRVGDTQQVSYSIGSSMLRQSDYRELLSASVGQIYYLRDRQVGLAGDQLDETTRSDMVAELEWRPLANLSIRGELLWDTYLEATNERSLRFRYTRDRNHIVNLAYRERGSRGIDPDGVSKEIDGSFIWPINWQWSIIGRHYRSISEGHVVEQLAGVEYNSCCWAMRAVRRGDFRVDPDALEAPFGEMRYRWYLEVEFRGLTSVGRRINSLLSDQILGFNAVN